MTLLLRDLNFKSPNSTTIERICYRGHLMKSGMALNFLRAFGRYADKQNIDIDSSVFDPQHALTEFGYRVVGLGDAIRKVSGQLINSEVDPVSDLAVAANLTPDAIVQMAQGRCVLVPSNVADDVSKAAMAVLKLADPLRVERLPPNNTDYKPVGANRVENGADAFRCPETAAIRQAVLNRVAHVSRAA
ncbi:hypothetical protein [Sagittula salina]|uniref:Uncharacterized protein n=1 Tax=Sagittula salina TaxID=2820268 RepID=A0A940S1H9_9RHOB|nr:hypothetical protein [Sagittula salina]MBP0484173.1 hypothetical protein [Sagittula salina]